MGVRIDESILRDGVGGKADLTGSGWMAVKELSTWQSIHITCILSFLTSDFLRYSDGSRGTMVTRL